MTREEHLEEIADDIESLNLFKQIKAKYRYSRIGFDADETCCLIRESIRKKTEYHLKTYNERVSVILMEALA